MFCSALDEVELIAQGKKRCLFLDYFWFQKNWYDDGHYGASWLKANGQVEMALITYGYDFFVLPVATSDFLLNSLHDNKQRMKEVHKSFL